MSLPSPNGLLEKLRNGKRSRSWPLRVAGIVGFLVTVFLLVSYNPGMRIALRPHSASHERPLHNVTKPLPYRHALESHIAHLEEIQRWQPPPGMRVIGLVFYGRRRFVTILNCYLQVCCVCASKLWSFHPLTASAAKFGGERWNH